MRQVLASACDDPVPAPESAWLTPARAKSRCLVGDGTRCKITRWRLHFPGRWVSVEPPLPELADMAVVPRVRDFHTYIAAGRQVLAKEEVWRLLWSAESGAATLPISVHRRSAPGTSAQRAYRRS